MIEHLEGDIVENEKLDVDPLAVAIVQYDQAQAASTGRPSEMTLETVNKLLIAFSNDYNITQACHYADISRETYYTWTEKNKLFSDKMKESKEMPLRRAREVVIGAIDNGDANLAFRYLERRDPEFKPKAEVNNNLGVQETREKIKDFLNDDSPDDGGSEPTSTDQSETGKKVAESPQDIS